MKEEKHFEVLSTKIDPAMAEVLNACCDALGVDVYHLLQWFAYTIIRASAPWHELDPRIQKLMAMLESDAGWQESFNIANPGNLKIAQIILILEQKGRKGFGAVMVDKPFMSDVRQTECVDDILERVTQVTMRGIYRRLRLLGGEMQCEHLSDVLLTMCERQNMMNAVDLSCRAWATMRIMVGRWPSGKKPRQNNTEHLTAWQKTIGTIRLISSSTTMIAR